MVLEARPSGTTPIGVHPDGTPATLAIRRHNLIIGRAGSGRPEVLTSALAGAMLTTSATELGFVIATSAATIGLPEPLLKAAHVRSYQTNLVIPAQRTRFLEQLVGAVASRRKQLRHHQVRSVTELLTRDATFAQDPELSDLIIIIDGLFEIPNPSELIVRIMHLLTLENALGIYLWLTDPAPLIPDVMNLFSDCVALQTISAAHSRDVIGIADAARISEAGVGFVKTGVSSPRLFRVLPPTGSDLDGIDTDSGRTSALRWSQALPESISLTETIARWEASGVRGCTRARRGDEKSLLTLLDGNLAGPAR